MSELIGVPKSYHDLLDAPFATFATIDPDGRPQLSEVWFLAEDGQVKLSLNTLRKKVRNLRRNPACTLFILDPVNPGRYLEIRGDARIEPDDDYEFASRVGAKYGADIRSFDPPGQTRVEVTIEPVRVNAVTMF
jgi:PPOX class probable F420-dependent enzyme